MESLRNGGATERYMSVSPGRSGRESYLSKTSTITRQPATSKTPHPSGTTSHITASLASLRSDHSSSELIVFSRLLKEKETTCARLTKSCEIMKREIEEKTVEVKRLRSLTETYGEKLKEYFAKDYEKLLTQRDAEIAALAEENKQLRSRLETETRKFTVVLAQNELKVTEMRTQLLAIMKKSKETEQVRSSALLYDALQKLQAENRLLTERIESQSTQQVTRDEFESLEEQFRGVEEMQDKVLAENAELKREVEDREVSEKLLKSHLQKAQAWLVEAKFELGQMLVVLKSLHSGSPIDPSSLLHFSRPSDLDSDPDSLDRFSRNLRSAKASLSELKTLMVDSYSEFCSQQTCGLQ